MRRPPTDTHTHALLWWVGGKLFLSLIQYLGQITAALSCFGCRASSSSSSRDLWLWHPGAQQHVSPVAPRREFISPSSCLSLCLPVCPSLTFYVSASLFLSGALLLPPSLSLSPSLTPSTVQLFLGLSLPPSLSTLKNVFHFSPQSYFHLLLSFPPIRCLLLRWAKTPHNIVITVFSSSARVPIKIAVMALKFSVSVPLI